MAVNKVVMNTSDGERTLIDLTSDSVTPSSLAMGATAHAANGEVITGEMPTTTVLYTEQTLTEAEQAQARDNIGAVAKAGGTMTGALVAQNNTDYAVAQTRNIFLVAAGSDLPTGGNGDICIVYTP